ncbi:MAG: helix-turn-helix transcriptional regulator [Nostocoides sp.]
MTRRRSAAAVEAAIGRLSPVEADSRRIREAALSILRDAVGFDWYVWVLTDPTTAVGTDPLAETPDLGRLGHLVRLKYGATVNRWTALADAACIGPSADAADPWLKEVRAQGAVDVLSGVHRDQHGTWGFLDLWRNAAYDEDEVGLLRTVLPELTARLRRCRADEFAEPLRDKVPSGPSVLLLDDDLRVLGATPSSTEVLRALLPTAPDARPVPASVFNVAAQLLASERGQDSHEPSGRVHVPGYGLLTLRASRVEPGGQIAVAIAPTTLADRLDLFVRAHGLTAREADVVASLATGADTAEVARLLFLSPHTVQDHLKAVFARTGTRSRRELLARAAG